jgi:ubiquinone/menaquinone biosynthesis C-methylase UbiE
LAWSYDAVAWTVSLGQWKEWGRTAIPYLRGPRVLDLAHGPGNLLPELAAAGFSPMGYDLSPAMGRIAQRKMGRWGVRVPLSRGMAQALPFPSGTFNSVVSTFPADFVLHPTTWSEVGRVLAPDGICVVVPVALLTGRGPLVRLIEALFGVTGQRLARSAEPLPQFTPTGFRSRVEWVSLPHSRVMVVLNYPLWSDPR